MYLKNDDTICAPATVPGTGAISVIRVSGPEALSIADKIVTCGKPGILHDPDRQYSVAPNGSREPYGQTLKGTITTSKGYTIRFGTVYTPDGKPLDEVLVSIFHAPHSYTGENSIEISCHASKYIVEQIMMLLIQSGARAAAPGEFTQRAFLNGKMDLAQAEAVADLIASQNDASHRIAFNQMKGGFSSELKGMRAELLNIVSLMELELDFSEEEVEFADRHQLNMLIDTVMEHISRLIESFRLGNAIKNGVPVAIAGSTNTGKSTLLNALLGEERAIVSDIHGTTRDTVEETMNVDGILFRFIDTAGIRETSEAIEKIGIERTYRKISEADIVLGMLDITHPLTELRTSIEKIVSKIDLDQQRLIFLLNKADILPAPAIVPGAASSLASEETQDVMHSPASIHIETSSLASRDLLIEEHHNKNVLIQNFIVSLIDNKIFNKHTPTIPILTISAKTQSGIQELKNLLASIQKDLMSDTGTTLVTNIRHIEALTRAQDSLTRVRSSLADGIPTDLVAQDIREALYYIGSIVGEISTNEVLGNIFQNFCIGK